MTCQSPPAASLAFVKFIQNMEPAALLAEALLQIAHLHHNSLGMPLADLVPAVIVLSIGQAGFTTFSATSGYVGTGSSRRRRSILLLIAAVLLAGVRQIL